ncbi:MAG: hypothetical protein M3Q23_01885 [Actinomycetota bacterium]|nr:hypothetical protein [Actinomycetota bacterium]
MRLLGRSLLAGAAAAVLLAVTAPGALAKGAGELAGGRAVVTGPGLAAPIVIRGKDLGKMLEWIGPVVPRLFEPRCCVRFMSPRPARLGPRYEVRYELRWRPRGGSGRGAVTVLTIRQDLYPYSPNEIIHLPVPWVFTPAGQTLTVGDRTHRVDSSWIDSSLVFDLLVARGLPAKAPPAPAAEASARGGGGPVMAVGLAALGVVLVGGALAARRSSRLP